jgi:hypothetical protein
MARRLRIVVAVLATALAVSLTAFMALPAAAHHKQSHGSGRAQGQTQGKNQGQSQNKGKGQSQSKGKSQGNDRSQAQAKGQSQSKGRSESQAQSQGQSRAKGRSQDKGKGRGQSGASGQGQGQRARGTVKIRSTGIQDGNRRNEPHPGCIFWVHHWGFDEREAVATFRAHPPTGKGEFLLSDTVQLPGPNQTVGGSYNLAPVFESLGIQPHHRQGYHVKLQVTSTDGRHLTKHKVFWIDCPVLPLGVPPGVPPVGVPPGVPPEDEVLGEEIVPEDVEEKKAVPPEDEVLGVIHERARPDVRGVRVAAAPEEERARPGLLPVTGGSGLAFLLAGLILIAVGAHLYRARRRWGAG